MTALQDDDRQLIREAVDKFVEDRYPFDGREKRAAGTDNWAAFAELGWLGLPFAEAAGGLGGGVEDVHVLVRAFGRALIEEPFLEVMLAGKVLECLGSDLLGAVVAGEIRPVLAHGEGSSGPGFTEVRCRARPARDGYLLSGCKRVVRGAGAADWWLLTALLEDRPALFRVAPDAAGVTSSGYPTIDSRRAADIHLQDTYVGREALLATGDDATRAVADAVLFLYAALAGEARGIADCLVATTASYLRTRAQFGSRLADFQALQHRLADMEIGAEEIRSLEWLVAGVYLLDEATERERVLRCAKARVGKLLRAVAESAVQLHGGMGVSDELAVGHYLRRAVAIDAFHGDAGEQIAWLATRA